MNYREALANTKAAKNAKQLVEAAVAQLQAAGWSEAKILEQLPYLASEAIKFLAAKQKGL